LTGRNSGWFFALFLIPTTVAYLVIGIPVFLGLRCIGAEGLGIFVALTLAYFPIVGATLIG
jgi:hypothetical protein